MNISRVSRRSQQPIVNPLEVLTSLVSSAGLGCTTVAQVYHRDRALQEPRMEHRHTHTVPRLTHIACTST